MAFTILDTVMGAQPIATTQATANDAHPLGTIIRAADDTYGAGEFIYLQGLASTEIGTWVTYNMDGFTTALLANNAIAPVAIAMSENVAGQYGWYQIQGKAIGKALTGFADNANVYSTTTAGSVDDAVVAGNRVKNAKGASPVNIPSSGLAEFEISRPFMDDGLAA